MKPKNEWKFNGVNYGEDYVLYRKHVTKYCMDNRCPFYYGEIDECMFGEDGVNEKVGIENRKCHIGMWR